LKINDAISQKQDNSPDEALALRYVAASISVQMLHDQWEDAPLNARQRYALTEQSNESVTRWIEATTSRREVRKRFNLF